jgi:Protein of unknown function (DUF3048) N-terminal domain/Protein of unknown function (DUF3048) C-terminal domain
VKRFLIILVLVVAVAAGSVYAFFSTRSTSASGPLTGENVQPGVANRRPIAVTIDNISPDARPQSGLDKASLVFETLAEGGITRFMAVYLEHDAAMIGPVRSTRFYFNSWAAALGVIFGHDGGNVDALQQLPSLATVYDEDAGRVAGPFWRIAARFAPHNEYTSTQRLRDYAQAHGGDVSGVRMSLPHKDDAPLSQRPAHFTLDIQFSYGDYNVTWNYDRQANDYQRLMGGSPHVEATTGKQLVAKNLIVMFADETPASDPFTPGAIHMRTEGTGKATVYEDGTATSATWSKDSVDAPLRWMDSNGNEIKLNRGATWVEVVPVGNAVTTH